MFNDILIKTDGSKSAEKAADRGLEIAKQLNAEVTAVTVGKLYEQRVAENAACILVSARGIAEGKGVPCTTTHVPDQYIVETAKARGCDVIVIGSHGRRGVTALLLGSVAAKMVALSPVPVLVCR